MHLRRLLILCAFFLLTRPALADTGVYTLANALREMATPDALAEGHRKNPRGVAVFKSEVAGDFLREQPNGECVMADIAGPGVITSITTSEPIGYLRLYWDGSDKPQWEGLWRELAAGRVTPVDGVFVHTGAGGSTIRFPLPFAKGMKITLAGQVWTDYRIEYQYFSPTQQAESWWPAVNPSPDVLDAYSDTVKALGNPPLVAPFFGPAIRMAVAVNADSPVFVYTAREQIAITEIALFALANEPDREDLTITIDGRTWSWVDATGGEYARGDILRGRVGKNRYIRAPFVLEEDGRIEFRWAGMPDDEFLGELIIRRGTADGSAGFRDFGYLVGNPQDAFGTVPAPDFDAIGRHQVDSRPGHDSVVYTENLPPVTAIPGQYVDSIETLDGTRGEFDLRIHSPAISHLRLSLDLPAGWKGQLARGDETLDVNDIGWPWFDDYEVLPGRFVCRWSAIPPVDLAAGVYTIQLRAEATMPGGVYVMRRALAIRAVSLTEPAIRWLAEEAAPGDDGSVMLDLPEGFNARPGDRLEVLARIGAGADCLPTTMTLRFTPGPVENSRGFPPEIAAHLPPDGVVSISMSVRDEARWLVLRPGDTQSWLGRQHRLMLELEGCGGASLQLREARLYRQPEPSAILGWSRRIPYVEQPEATFHLPRASMLLAQNKLRDAIKVVSGQPRERVGPEYRRAEYLENIEAGPMVWRVADPPRRPAWLRPSHSFVFRAENTGSRIAILDERLAGARFIGVEFGYGPECGIVGVRDCEGRLIAVQNLWLDKPRTVPQWTWIALPVPNRDGWIYLESLGRAPGSLAQHVVFQKIMAVGDMDETTGK